MLEVQNVSKRYGNLAALEDVSATFFPGEVHAVLGENGAGKSTLTAILSGFVRPNLGSVNLDGEQIPLGRAAECKRIGIEMIHQHFTLVPDFSVVENLALARLPKLAALSKVEERAKPSLAAAARLGWGIDPSARVRDLAVGEQQRLEILKALGGDARVLILDEPTAVLGPDEVADLFRVLRTLKEEGKIVILIAHKLAEVLAVADRVTVLRKGRFVATAKRDEVDATKLANWMVGAMPQPPEAAARPSKFQPGLRVDQLVVKGDRGDLAIRGITFEIGKGEILGLGGVDGNGQVELAEAVAGVRQKAAGEMYWLGEDQMPKTGYVPQDRQTDGLALLMSIEENLLIGGVREKALTRGPLLRTKAIRAWAKELAGKFDVRGGGPKDAVGALSGGNQQKVVVSRALDGGPELLVVVNPTRGLDIRATQFVHDTIRSARDRGAAILLISTDLDELFALTDRRYFLSRGALVADAGALSVVGG